MSDASLLVRDIAGDAAGNAATRIKPSEERLSQIDAPADDNTWHDVPDLSPAALKAQAKDQYSKNKPLSKGDIQNATDNTGSAAQDPNADPGAAAQNQAGSLAAKATQNLKQNVPDEHQDKARDLQNRTRGYLNEKVPKERREQTIYRLKKMVVEVQSHSDCKAMYYLPSFRSTKQLQIRKPSRPSCLSPSNIPVTAKVLSNKGKEL